MVRRQFVEWWQRQTRSFRKWVSSGRYAFGSGRRPLRASRQLVRWLHLAASYNDKGFYWLRHSPAQVQRTRQEYQQEIDALLVRVDASSLPAELRAALRSGAAVRDDSGRYVEQARRWLLACEN